MRFILLLGFVGLISFCAASPLQAQSIIRIVASTGMISDAARFIVGQQGDVQTLLGSGVDPHLYKPTRSDIIALTSADLVIYNGLLLEGGMSESFERIATAGRPILALAPASFAQDELLAPDGFAGHYDPHVWMDPFLWRKVVRPLAERFSSLLPQHRAEFMQRAQEYEGLLQALHEYAEKTLKEIPERRRTLITAHDAFNYFGRRYGFDVRGIQGISTESEASVKDIEDLVHIIVDRNIPSVFVESTIAEKSVRALIEGARARGHAVALGGKLFSDAMGSPGTYEGTYIGMIDHNVTTIARGLGGNPPPRGMQGKLSE